MYFLTDHKEDYVKCFHKEAVNVNPYNREGSTVAINDTNA